MSSKRKSTITIVASIISSLALLGYFVYCEVSYARLKDPAGMATIADFYNRFQSSSLACVVLLEDTEFLCLTGPLPAKWSFALPSSPPVYVFNKQGVFVDWCSDPGDDSEWSQKWLNYPSSPLNDSEVHDLYDIGKDTDHE